MGYRLVPVEGLGPADVERVRAIYEAGFPVWLRADFGSLLAGRQPGELPLALTEEGRPVGFAMLRPLGTTGWMFLRYFVVDAARRLAPRVRLLAAGLRRRGSGRARLRTAGNTDPVAAHRVLPPARRSRPAGDRVPHPA
jgi:hypothetical protein